MKGKILMALDGFPVTGPALDQIECMVKQFNAQVLLVRVLNNAYSMRNASFDDRADAWIDSQEYLTRIQTDLEARGLDVSGMIDDGQEIEVLTKIAREEKVELIALRDRLCTGKASQELFMNLLQGLKDSNISLSLIHY